VKPYAFFSKYYEYPFIHPSIKARTSSATILNFDVDLGHDVVVVIGVCGFGKQE
jgi:hypothetical protein